MKKPSQCTAAENGDVAQGGTRLAGTEAAAALGCMAGGKHGRLDRVSAFDATAHTLDGALLKPVQGLFDVGQRASIGLAGERALLERAQAISHDGEQCFVRDAVDARFRDGAVLEKNRHTSHDVVMLGRRWVGAFVVAGDVVAMASATRAGPILDRDGQRVICGVDLVVVDGSHEFRSFAAVGEGSKTQDKCNAERGAHDSHADGAQDERHTPGNRLIDSQRIKELDAGDDCGDKQSEGGKDEQRLHHTLLTMTTNTLCLWWVVTGGSKKLLVLVITENVIDQAIYGVGQEANEHEGGYGGGHGLGLDAKRSRALSGVVVGNLLEPSIGSSHARGLIPKRRCCRDGATAVLVRCNHGEDQDPHRSTLLRRLVGGLRSALGFHKLGPDAVPVVRTKVPAANGAIGGMLDLHASLDRNRPVTSDPFADGWLADAESHSHLGLASEGVDCFLDRVHAHKYRHCRCSLQVHCL